MLTFYMELIIRKGWLASVMDIKDSKLTRSTKNLKETSRSVQKI